MSLLLSNFLSFFLSLSNSLSLFVLHVHSLHLQMYSYKCKYICCLSHILPCQFVFVFSYSKDYVCDSTLYCVGKKRYRDKKRVLYTKWEKRQSNSKLIYTACMYIERPDHLNIYTHAHTSTSTCIYIHIHSPYTQHLH